MDYYGFLLITLLITFSAQAYLDSKYSKCLKIDSKKHMNGAEVARKILEENGLENVEVVISPGVLGDHYDPKEKTVCLSNDVFLGDSIAAVSIAAHECGHAIQDKNGYLFLRLRSMFIPAVNLASSAGYFAIMIGIFAGLTKILWIGILCEFIILLFQLVTLPVEFNASSRGLNQLVKLKIIQPSEKSTCCEMLRAAAFTYVAAAATAAFEILRLVWLADRRRD